MRAVEFDLNKVLPTYLLESYCIAINACDDNATISYANYLIDLSLLNIEFCQFEVQIIAIVALAEGLSRTIQNATQADDHPGVTLGDPKKSYDTPSVEATKNSLVLLSKMAKHEGVSKKDYRACQLLFRREA